MNKFGDWLVEQRELKGISQNKLAEKMNFSQAAVSRVESGKVSPTSDFIIAVAEALDMPLELVYRRGGLLPPKPERDEWVEKTSLLMSKLPAESRNFLEQMIKYMYDRERDGNGRGK
jgi:transcriptional regulator with XRE-family HTH domain